MTIYSITYDLKNKDSEDYQDLYKELDKKKAWLVAESTYLIRTDQNNTKIVFDHFKNYIKANDTLIVSKVDDAEIRAQNTYDPKPNWAKSIWPGNANSIP